MNKTKMQRYTWEDALIEALAVGLLTKRAAFTGLQLSRVINWTYKSGPALRWDNDSAFESTGISRATGYRAIENLKTAGYLKSVQGNLTPALPESQSETHEAWLTLNHGTTESHSETVEDAPKSQSETAKSQSETAKSQSETHNSDDLYSDNLYSEDSGADAPVDDDQENEDGVTTSRTAAKPQDDSDDFLESTVETVPLGGGAATENSLESPQVPNYQIEARHQSAKFFQDFLALSRYLTDEEAYRGAERKRDAKEILDKEIWV